MNDLKPSTQALLDLGRLGDDPTDAAIGKNRRALAQRLGVATLGASAIAGSTSKAAAVSFGAWTTLKTALLCGTLLIGSVVVWKVVDRSHPTGLEHQAVVRSAEPVKPALPTPVLPQVAPPATSASESPVPSALPSPIAHAAPAGRSAAGRSIKEELELVRGAQQQLNRGEPRAALALLDEHARRFPSGVLWEDREASRVFAVCRMGNAAAARALADAFIRRAPKSPFVDRVRAACREASPSNAH